MVTTKEDKMRKVFAWSLIFVLVFSVFPVHATVSEPFFSDMPDDDTAAAMNAAVQNGLLKGYAGKIYPEAYLTRAEMATIMTTAFGAQMQASLEGYSDIERTDWYYAPMAKAVQMKIVRGDGKYLHPNAFITREQVYAILARALKLEGGTSEDLIAFADRAELSDWATESAAAVAKAGYVKGELNPKEKIKRKEFVLLMDRILKHHVGVSGNEVSFADGSVIIRTPDVTLRNMKIKGDLIIADGVGAGDVTLDNVVVQGRMVVRGGGLHSVVIKGNSKISKVIVGKIDGNIRIAVDDTADVETVYAEDGKNEIVIEGNLGKLVTQVSDAAISVRNGQIGTLEVKAEKAKVTVDANAKIQTVTVLKENIQLHIHGKVDALTTQKEAKGAQIDVAKGGVIQKVTALSESGKIRGEGRVGEVDVKGNDVVVQTANTKVTVESGVEGTLAGNREMKSGEVLVTEDPSSKSGEAENESGSQEESADEDSGNDDHAGDDSSGGNSDEGETPAPADPEITDFVFTPVADLKAGSANTSINAVVGSFGSESGGTAPFTYALVPGDGDAQNSRFAVSGKNLLVVGENLTAGEYQIRVQVTDTKGKVLQKKLSLQVAAPMLLEFEFEPLDDLEEGTASVNAGAVVGNFTMPAGGIPPYTFALVSGDGDKDNDKFEIDGMQVKVKANPLPAGIYELRVQMQDANDKTYQNAISLEVFPQHPDPPVIHVSKESARNREKGITFELEMLPNHEYFYRLVDSSTSHLTEEYMTYSGKVTLNPPDADENESITIYAKTRYKSAESDVSVKKVVYASSNQVPKPIIGASQASEGPNEYAVSNRSRIVIGPLNYETGRKFYYTTDGSDPDTSSNRMIGELELQGNDTDQEYVLIVKVMAAESGRENSPITVVKIKFKAKK